MNATIEKKIQEFRNHVRKAREAATELGDAICKQYGVGDLEEVSEHHENAMMEIDAALTEAIEEGLDPLEELLKSGVAD